MSRRESEDARFEELMAREFPDGLVPTERARPLLDETQGEPARPESGAQAAPPQAAPPEVARPELQRPEPQRPEPQRPEPQPDPDPNPAGFRNWAPDDEPDEPFEPPLAPPMGRWTTAGLTGTTLVLLPVLVVLLAAFGLILPMLVWVLAGCGVIVGVVLLLQRLRKRPPMDGDGAVL